MAPATKLAPCPVDIAWLTKEGAALGAAAGTPKRPAVAGGSGLIGSNLLVFLAGMPGVEKIRVIDRVPPQKLVTAGIEDKIEFVEGRFGPGECERLKEAVAGCDCVFMVFTPPLHHARAHEFFETNVDGVRELVKACGESGVGRIVYASSIAVTSMMVESFNQAESDPLPPIETYETPYDISKRKGEEILLEAPAEYKDLKVCCLRFGGVLLGPRDFFFAYVWPVIPGLIWVPWGKPVNFIDGRDVCRALAMAAQGLEQKPEEVSREVFFATGFPYTPGELSSLTAAKLECPFGSIPDFITHIIIFLLRLWYDVQLSLGMVMPGVRPDQIISAAFIQKTFDNSKVKKVLGFEPVITMEDAVGRVVDLHLLETGRSKGCGRFVGFVVACLVLTICIVMLTLSFLTRIS